MAGVEELAGQVRAASDMVPGSVLVSWLPMLLICTMGAIMKPRNRLPQSPMKTRAGLKFRNRNPARLPSSASVAPMPTRRTGDRRSFQSLTVRETA